jgi:hypothetical protein
MSKVQQNNSLVKIEVKFSAQMETTQEKFKLIDCSFSFTLNKMELMESQS